jgi:hypothetical protein
VFFRLVPFTTCQVNLDEKPTKVDVRVENPDLEQVG